MHPLQPFDEANFVAGGSARAAPSPSTASRSTGASTRARGAHAGPASSCPRRSRPSSRVGDVVARRPPGLLRPPGPRLLPRASASRVPYDADDVKDAHPDRASTPSRSGASATGIVSNVMAGADPQAAMLAEQRRGTLPPAGSAWACSPRSSTSAQAARRGRRSPCAAAGRARSTSTSTSAAAAGSPARSATCAATTWSRSSFSNLAPSTGWPRGSTLSRWRRPARRELDRAHHRQAPLRRPGLADRAARPARRRAAAARPRRRLRRRPARAAPAAGEDVAGLGRGAPPRARRQRRRRRGEGPRRVETPRFNDSGSPRRTPTPGTSAPSARRATTPCSPRRSGPARTGRTGSATSPGGSGPRSIDGGHEQIRGL